MITEYDYDLFKRVVEEEPSVFEGKDLTFCLYNAGHVSVWLQTLYSEKTWRDTLRTAEAQRLSVRGISSTDHRFIVRVTEPLNDPSPELEQRVQESYARIEPERIFHGCKVAEVSGVIVVRVYSRRRQYPHLRPIPYQIYRFDSAMGILSVLSPEEAAPYVIHNYK